MKGKVTIGILALQGAFAEHETILRKISSPFQVCSLLVRTPYDLAKCDGLIIPGGESTTIALLAELSGLLDPLKEFVNSKPIWGTCAGAILLAQTIENPKKGGQELLHAMSLTIARNGWGSQVDSFEVPLIMENVDGLQGSDNHFMGIFIRAPVITEIHSPEVRVLARLPPDALRDKNDTRGIVAVEQGMHLLTTFHPELTKDGRFHEYFVQKSANSCFLSQL